MVAIPGAASGIGRATALGLSRQGVRIASCNRNPYGLASVSTAVQNAGGQARMVALDVSDQAPAAQAIDGIVHA